MSGYIDSYYARTLTEPGNRPALDGAVDAEICVIGGGLAGLATALDLAERGRSVVLLEQHTVGWGASGRNGGFVSMGYPNGIPALVERVGMQEARELYKLARMGHALVRERIADYAIDCGPVADGALRCAMAGQKEALQAFCDYMEKEFDTKYEYWPGARLRQALATKQYGEAFHNPHNYSVHPLNLCRGLARAVEARGGRILEQSTVTRMDLRGIRKRIATRSGEVRADHVVIAAGGYVGNLFWPVSAATVPIATFVMVTEPLGDRLKNAISVPYAISDIKTPTNYYRPLAEGRLLWGGRVLAWQPGARSIARGLKRDMVSFYPDLADARVEVAWGGMMPFLRNKLPSFGQLTPGVWYATRFGGLGLALTTTAGRLIAAGITEGDDRWRLYAKFGLPFAGGALGRIPAQFVYWRQQAAARFGHFRSP
ncbi:MAG: FAD-binding oxidoreductase [Alphaproteobacteria bacterium]|nr:FAD-binding oxidoreductase [Alphaproteobacteria bacterium]